MTANGRAFAAMSIATLARNAASLSYSDSGLRRMRFVGENGALVGACSISKSDRFREKGSPSELRLDEEEAEETTDIVDGGMTEGIGRGPSGGRAGCQNASGANAGGLMTTAGL